MAELAYREVYTMNRKEARRHLVHTYEQTQNYSQTARQWHTSRQASARAQPSGGAQMGPPLPGPGGSQFARSLSPPPPLPTSDPA